MAKNPQLLFVFYFFALVFLFLFCDVVFIFVISYLFSYVVNIVAQYIHLKKRKSFLL